MAGIGDNPHLVTRNYAVSFGMLPLVLDYQLLLEIRCYWAPMQTKSLFSGLLLSGVFR
jgi:hypothetical protein